MATFLDYDFASPLPHPGEILREDFLAPLGMTPGALAKAMGLKDRMRLERVFGASAQFWMNLQAQHDLSNTAMEKRAEILGIGPLAAA